MKIAYHFNCSNIDTFYDKYFYEILFNVLLELKEPFLSSKVLVGDLLLQKVIGKFNNKEEFFENLFLLSSDNWKKILKRSIDTFLEKDVFIICFETIQKDIANKLHEALTSIDRYLGALEIDNSDELHWWLYGECIGAKYRILNRDLSILVDDQEIESKEYFLSEKESFDNIPFSTVQVELKNFRYSLFDDKHNFENAKRATIWKKSTDSLFSTITDEIIAKLTDIAPELTDKLWAINETFSNAQIGEQYAQAMTSCRRTFEYVIDCLFPAINEVIDGHSLKKDKYKNRLYEFAKREVKSDTNIDLIVTNTASLFEEWEKLYELSNKGVHSEPHRQECRRCIIRTILLLDDLIALKNSPFDVSVNTDKSIDWFMAKYKNTSR